MATQVSFLTALGPNDPDDGEAGRVLRVSGDPPPRRPG